MLVTSFDDLAMVRQAVQQRSRHFRVTEDTGPFTEGEISGDDDRGALVKAADQVEQQLTTRLSKEQIAQFVEDDEVEACKVIGHATLFAAASLSLQPVHQIDHVEEAATCAGADKGAGTGTDATKTAVLWAYEENGTHRPTDFRCHTLPGCDPKRFAAHRTGTFQAL